MNKLVVLNLGQGNFHKGFPDITVQLGLANDLHRMEFRGSLPPAPEITQLYQNWQLLYSALYQRYGWSVRLGVVEDASLTNFSEAEFELLCQELSSRINTWLGSEQFHEIEQRLRTELNKDEEISFIISSGDKLSRRLPWHLWKFFKDYPNAEVGLAPLELQRLSRKQKKDKKLNIIAIFGNSERIDISKDKSFLEKLSNKAKINFLIEPSRKKLSDELWAKDWDILFFAGHSYSDETGVLQINQNTTITLDKLKHGLEKAIKNGLQLAIFNSCDGLGLAEALEDLHIPHIIVMREPVPDLVAQEFFKHFLTLFSRGRSLYSSLHEARKRLEGIEDRFPCATWLPIICHNPLETAMIWKQHKKIITYKNVSVALLVSLLVTILIMGVRYLGLLQPSELKAFDHFMQLRSQVIFEKKLPDPNLLIVTIDEDDIQYQLEKNMHMKWSLADEALDKLLKKLEAFEPVSIGIDIYRDSRKEKTNFPDLARSFKQDKRLFFVCKASNNNQGNNGTPPPPEVLTEQVGFSDFVEENGVVRRQLLQMKVSGTRRCFAQESFNLKIARHYLAEKHQKNAQILEEGDLKIGNVVFKRLKQHSSGYQRIDAKGYQILLNYRSGLSLDKIVPTFTLTEVLEDEIEADVVSDFKNRIVLIGITNTTTSNNGSDRWETPLSSTDSVPGVFVQAHMISQILSSVLDGRPLFWWWPLRLETLWVWGWSLLGAIVVLYCAKPLHLGIAVIASLFTLFCICFSIFTLKAGWIPSIPPALGLLVTQTVIVLWLKRKRSSIAINTNRPL